MDPTREIFQTVAVIVSVAFLVGSVTSDLPLTTTNTSNRSHIRLGSPRYDMEALMGPRVDGWFLRVAAYLLSHGWVGQLGRRPLINLNGPDEMRELANQANQQNIPMVFHPLCRNPSINVTDAMAATATTAVQQGGLTKSYNPSQVVGVLDYYEAYLANKVTPSQMMFRVFEAMDKLKFMNIFVEVNIDDVLEQARASDKRWEQGQPWSVFDGVPVTVKGVYYSVLYCIVYYTNRTVLLTCCCFPIFNHILFSIRYYYSSIDATIVKGFTKSEGMPRKKDGKPSTEDDIMVRRLRDAGAIILGTTVMTEFGRCPLGYNSHFQGPFNPYNEGHYTGGSSSGSVASVMTGIVPIGISFDGGGSIRIPAAFSGSFGLAPTFGRVPCQADDAYVSGNIHAGTNTATTTDTALAYALLGQNDRDHFYAQWYDGGKEGPPRPHLTDFDKIEDLSDLRIGVFWDYFNDCDPEIAQQCKDVLQKMQSRGATLVDVVIPNLNALDLAHGVTISMEMSFLQERDFFSRKDLEPATMIQLALANSMTGVEFLAASRLRGWAMDYMAKLFAEQIDVFVTPGTPITAPPIPKGALDCGELDMPLMVIVMRYVFLVNLTGIPGMVSPIGYSDESDLPISIQFMTSHWNDALLLRLSHFVEKKVFQRRDPKHFVKLSLE